MSRKEIDMSTDPRVGQFAYFTAMNDPWAGATVMVDIDEFKKATQGKPFFLSFLYCVIRAANRVPNLRRRLLDDGTVVEYDFCDPSYTAMKPDGVYVYCTVDKEPTDYESYLAYAAEMQKKVIDRGTLTEEGDILQHYFVSCVPWLPYIQIKMPGGLPQESNPRISWGKATVQEGRLKMPVAIFAHHALADGIHISQFYQYLDEEIVTLTKQLQSKTI